MQTHELTAADAWFIEKGQIDILSRSLFQIGDEVVVCDRQHVMLAKFYDGECPICHRRVTVPFSRETVENGTLRSYTGQCPFCTKKVTILFRQQGADGLFLGKCPVCSHELSVNEGFFEKPRAARTDETYIKKAIAFLYWTLGILTVGVIVLSLTGAISNEGFVLYAKKVIWPRTRLLYDSISDFAVSEKFNRAFLSFNRTLGERTDLLLQRGAAVPALMEVGSKEICISLWERSTEVFIRSKSLLQFLVYRTKLLFAYIRE